MIKPHFAYLTNIFRNPAVIMTNHPKSDMELGGTDLSEEAMFQQEESTDSTVTVVPSTKCLANHDRLNCNS